MDECIQRLEKTGEKSDRSAIFFLKVSRFMESIPRTLSRIKQSQMMPSRAPPHFYVEDLSVQLENLERQLPPELQHDDITLMNLEIARGNFFDIGMMSEYPVGDTNAKRLSKLDLLYNCLVSTKTLFNRHLNLNSTDYASATLLTWAGINFRLRVALKLCFLECPGWNLNHARERLQLPLILDGEIERINSVTISEMENPPRSGRRSIYQHCALKMQQIKSFYESTLKRSTELQADFDFSALDLIASLDENFWNGILKSDFESTISGIDMNRLA